MHWGPQTNNTTDNIVFDLKWNFKLNSIKNLKKNKISSIYLWISRTTFFPSDFQNTKMSHKKPKLKFSHTVLISRWFIFLDIQKKSSSEFPRFLIFLSKLKCHVFVINLMWFKKTCKMKSSSKKLWVFQQIPIFFSFFSIREKLVGKTLNNFFFCS